MSRIRLRTDNAPALRVYLQTETAHGQVWVEGKVLRPLGAGWAQCVAASDLLPG